jgi:hypothetical protein
MLARQGLSCDVSSLVRIRTATAEQCPSAGCGAGDGPACPVPSDGPPGKRVRVSLDGGRVRLRRTHRGRKTAKGAMGFPHVA